MTNDYVLDFAKKMQIPILNKLDIDNSAKRVPQK